MDDQPVQAPAADEPAEQRATEHPPSHWLALAFVGLLSMLVLLGTTGIGAAAATLLGGPEIVCGGP